MVAVAKRTITTEEPLTIDCVAGVEEAKERVARRLDQWHQDMENEGDLVLELSHVSRGGAPRILKRQLYSLSDHPGAIGDMLVEIAKEDGEVAGRGKMVYKIGVSDREKLGQVSFHLTFPDGDEDEPELGMVGKDAVLAVVLKHQQIAFRDIRAERESMWTTMRGILGEVVSENREYRKSGAEMMRMFGEIWQGKALHELEIRKLTKTEDMKEKALDAVANTFGPVIQEKLLGRAVEPTPAKAEVQPPATEAERQERLSKLSDAELVSTFQDMAGLLEVFGREIEKRRAQASKPEQNGQQAQAPAER